MPSEDISFVTITIFSLFKFKIPPTIFSKAFSLSSENITFAVKFDIHSKRIVSALSVISDKSV